MNLFIKRQEQGCLYQHYSPGQKQSDVHLWRIYNYSYSGMPHSNGNEHTTATHNLNESQKHEVGQE